MHSSAISFLMGTRFTNTTKNQWFEGAAQLSRSSQPSRVKYATKNLFGLNASAQRSIKNAQKHERFSNAIHSHAAKKKIEDQGMKGKRGWKTRLKVRLSFSKPRTQSLE